VELERLWRRLQPLAVSEMPLAVPPPRDSRFGSPLVLCRVHWVRPELVAEVKYLTWTGDNLLRQVVYEGLRKDKPAAEVRRSLPFPKPAAALPSTHGGRAAEIPSLSSRAVNMIAAPVIPHCEIDQLAANARGPCVARQFAQLASHLPAMVAVGERRPRLAHGHVHPGNERAASRCNNRTIAAMARQYLVTDRAAESVIRRANVLLRMKRH
jgi:hypothetical protein